MAEPKKAVAGGSAGSATASGSGGPPAERREKLGDREVVHYADGRASEWTDTGEVFDREAWDADQILNAGAEAAQAKHEQLNKPIYFWAKEYLEGEEAKKNTIRGFLVSFFEPPMDWGAATDDESDEGQRMERLAAWVLTTLPTWCKTIDKKLVVVPFGTMVWMDITHANVALVRAARPKYDDDGQLVSAVEMQVKPLRKTGFPSKTKPGETWQSWRMDVSGGWKQALDDERTKRKSGFRILNKTHLQQLTRQLTTPEVLSMAVARKLVGLDAPARPALMAAGDMDLPALPSAGTLSADAAAPPALPPAATSN